jgi:pimeloyl-ACP methyl ester carboxylesterase
MEDMNNDSTTHEIHIEGHKLVALSFNPDAPGLPTVLLHGILASVHFWSPDLLAPFLDCGPCYALSLPGHYPAAFPPAFSEGSLTAEMIARVLTAAIRQLVGERPVLLVGHSTGGFAALDVAAHTPQIARGVLSISGFTQGRWTGWLGMNQRLVRLGLVGRFAFKSLFRMAYVRPVYRATARFYAANPRALFAYPHFERAIDDAIVDFRRLDLDGIIQYFAVMPSVDIGPLVARVPAPALILTGDHDPIVPPAQSYTISKQIPSAELAVIEGAGHLPFFENPGDYGLAVENWLRRHLG